MKTSNIIIAAIILTTVVTQSCTENLSRIEGIGTITTQELDIADFSGINMEGADDVFINYGQEQKVVVTGHPNIISRIQTDVINGTWFLELDRGNYGRYELTYNITLPSIETVRSIGSGNVTITDPLETDQMDISITGSGSFSGFQLSAQTCQVNINGSGNCEVTATNSLDVNIDGSGSVYYKGTPSITDDISGSGRVINSN